MYYYILSIFLLHPFNFYIKLRLNVLYRERLNRSNYGDIKLQPLIIFYFSYSGRRRWIKLVTKIIPKDEGASWERETKCCGNCSWEIWGKNLQLSLFHPNKCLEKVTFIWRHKYLTCSIRHTKRSRKKEPLKLLLSDEEFKATQPFLSFLLNIF